ncbi:MAG: protoheme IX farnesyltransferase, partial [Myxococcales bacterium]
SAASGAVDRGALLLFTIVFVWQVPHFLAIAWVYRGDYAAAGYRVMTVAVPDGLRVARHVVAGCLLLIPVSLLPTFFGLVGAIYYVGTLIIGIMFLVFALELARLRDVPAARQLMLASLVYLPTLFVLMSLDKVAV